MESVGVRELRQNASALPARVATSGESIEITSHDHPIAQLVPIRTRESSTRQELIESGRLRPGRSDPPAVIPVELPPGSASTDELLGEGPFASGTE